MHDAAEAFIGDVTRPLKSLLPEYKAIERRIEEVIADRFALSDLCDHGLIKQADLRMLAAEQADMMPAHNDSWACLAGVEVPEIRWRNWLPLDAAAQWLGRAEKLLGFGLVTELEQL